MIFDLLSAEYGWKTEYILTLTIREIAWRVDALNKRKQEELRINADLHGVKLKAKSERFAMEQLSSAQQDKLSEIVALRMSKGRR